MVVTKGCVVTYICTIHLDDGSPAFDETNTWSYTHGDRLEAQGMQDGLAGMSVGEEKAFTIVPSKHPFGQVADHYAEFVLSPDLLPKSVSDAIEWEDPGSQSFEITAPNGKTIKVFIREIYEDGRVYLDVNHRLSGETLHVAAKILDIKPPQIKARKTQTVSHQSRSISCTGCGGAGTITCSFCGGRGFREVSSNRLVPGWPPKHEHITDRLPCPTCYRTGRKQCSLCGGKGHS